MKAARTLVLAAVITLAAGGSVPAQEASLHGSLRYQVAATVDDATIIRNAVTADVELGYRGSDVDLLLNPFFEGASGAEPDLGLREVYIDYYSRFVDLRAGKQIIIWGTADGLAITDIVSPKDLTNFLIPEFRELRLGIPAVRATAYLGPTALELVYVPVFTPSVLPDPGSVWFTSLDTPVAPTVNPTPSVGSSVADGEFYLRFGAQTSALDFDLAGGYYWTNEPSPTIEKEFSGPGVISAINVTPEHYRQWLAGITASSSVGPFILRGEFGYFTPRRFLTADMADANGYVEKDYLQSIAGADTVLAGIDISGQILHQYIVDHESTLSQDQHSWTGTVRARRSFLQEQLVVDLFSYIGFSAPDALIKTGLTLQPEDALAFRAEANLFFGEDGQFGQYDGNDLVVVSARYSY